MCVFKQCVPEILLDSNKFTNIGLATDIAHLGATTTRHLVAAIELGESSLALVARAHLGHRHTLLTATSHEHVSHR